MRKALIAVLLFFGCGSEREITPKGDFGGPPAAPNPEPVEPGAPAPDFASIQPILQRACLRCHTGEAFLTNEAAWRASSAKQRVTSLNMPQPGSNEARTLSGADRAKLVAF